MRCFRNLRGLVAAATLMGLAAPADAIIAGTEEADYFHQQLSGQYHDSVFMQYAYDLDTSPLPNSFATASVINSRYLLTAAHTVYDADYLTYDIKGQEYIAEQWWVPAAYDNVDFWDHDIAVVRVDRDMTGVDPLGITRDDNLDLQGKWFEMVGFGGTAGLGPEGLRRAARNRYDFQSFELPIENRNTLHYDLDRLPIDWDFQLNIHFDSDVPLPMEGMTYFGDSGGPDVYKGEIVGVHSGIYGAVDFDHAVERGFSTDVRDYHQWIDAIAFGGPNSGLDTVWGLAGSSITDLGVAPTPISGKLSIAQLIAEGWLDPETGIAYSPMLRDQGNGETPFAGMSEADAAAAAAEILAHYSPYTSDELAFQRYLAFEAMQNRLYQQYLDTLEAGETPIELPRDYLTANAMLGTLGTDGSTLVYGAPIGPGWTPPAPMKPGDFDGDGDVDGDDLDDLIDRWGDTGEAITAEVEGEIVVLLQADENFIFDGNLNFDTVVDGLDLKVMLEDYTVSETLMADLIGAIESNDRDEAQRLFSVATIPEPTTGLLLMAGLGLAWRRTHRG